MKPTPPLWILLFTLIFMASKTLATDLALPKADLLKLSQQADKNYKEGAVVLHKNMKGSIDQNGFETYQFYIAIKILDAAAARDYSKLSASFNGYYSERHIDFARVVTNEGEVVNLKEDAIIREHEGMNSKSMDDIQSVSFALPNVKEGNIIELLMTTNQIKQIVENEWFSRFRMNYVQVVESRNWARVDPVMSAKLELAVSDQFASAQNGLKFKTNNLDVEPDITQKDGCTVYSLTVENLPGIKIEKNMPSLSTLLPTIKFTSVNNWKVLDDWAMDLFQTQFQVTPDIASLANTLAQPDDSELEKVNAVFEYVQNNVRYIGAHVNRGGYKPHSATEVLQQAYGDCKDQTALIIALLEALDVKAYAALITPAETNYVDTDFPLLNFSHMITYVPGVDIWLDTSDQTGNFPGIFGTLEAQQSFVITGSGGEIKVLNARSPSENSVTVLQSFETDGQNLNLTLKFSFLGHMDTFMRNIINNVPDASVFIRQLVAPFISTELTSYEINHQEDWSTPLELIVTLDNASEFSDELNRFSYVDTMASLGNAFTEFSVLPKPEDRQHDFKLAFPFQMNFSRDYPNVLDGGVLGIVQKATEIDSPYFSLTHSGEMDDNHVRLTTSWQLKQRMVKRADYPDFYNETKQIYKHAASTFIYVKDMKSIAGRKPETSELPEQLKYAESLLDAGEFAKALEHTTQLIADFPDSGKAHYFHAVALGFDDQYDASEKMFEKADELGY